ncbi:SDR family NAD(P)-dependent oxidoreductase [Novosphingobium sp. MD-1]|uniref:SDR family NAD(P)-dependent oxidoreductase n=1 Tax=Novosphingobium sp. MD-1 TaxID=1630648 RepID=UPI00061CA9ED|nr:SDR family oxidoreductase [Novosphingobium sp. MD-1]GAO55788.1 D-beta-hydroxybutyrate dehydrogenase [Novosphingobium sp. MD-1]
MANLNGKVALVTGGAAGIGRAISDLFSAMGARVVTADLSSEADIACDVADERQIEAMVSGVLGRHGQLDIAVNNAGILGPLGKMLADVEAAEWDRAMNVNLKGVFLCMKHELRAMAVQGCGTIINLSSVMGFLAAPRNPAYSAAKHGVLGLTKATAVQYASQGIRINAICPGLVETNMAETIVTDDALPNFPKPFIPMGRSATPREIAEVALWLASDASSYLTGEAIGADGGWRIL